MTVTKFVKWKRKWRRMIHKMRFAQANSSSTLSKRLTWNVSARAKMALTPVVITVVEKNVLQICIIGQLIWKIGKLW
jgi:hypothetical protein